MGRLAVGVEASAFAAGTAGVLDAAGLISDAFPSDWPGRSLCAARAPMAAVRDSKPATTATTSFERSEDGSLLRLVRSAIVRALDAATAVDVALQLVQIPVPIAGYVWQRGQVRRVTCRDNSKSAYS